MHYAGTRNTQIQFRVTCYNNILVNNCLISYDCMSSVQVNIFNCGNSGHKAPVTPPIAALLGSSNGVIKSSEAGFVMHTTSSHPPSLISHSIYALACDRSGLGGECSPTAGWCSVSVEMTHGYSGPVCWLLPRREAAPLHASLTPGSPCTGTRHQGGGEMMSHCCQRTFAKCHSTRRRPQLEPSSCESTFTINNLITVSRFERAL